MLGLQHPNKNTGFQKMKEMKRCVLTKSGTAFILHIAAVKAVLTLDTPFTESTVSIDSDAPEAVD